MIKFELAFSYQQMKAFLERRGFEVRRTKEKMFRSVSFHDDLEEIEKEVWGVYRNNEEHNKPNFREFSDGDWVTKVFNEEVSKVIANL